MSRASIEEQFKFLISCVRWSNGGRVDFYEVAKECGIVSKGAATKPPTSHSAKRYERMMKAHGIGASIPGAFPPSTSRTSPKTKDKEKSDTRTLSKKRKLELELCGSSGNDGMIQRVVEDDDDGCGGGKGGVYGNGSAERGVKKEGQEQQQIWEEGYGGGYGGFGIGVGTVKQEAGTGNDGGYILGPGGTAAGIPGIGMGSPLPLPPPSTTPTPTQTQTQTQFHSTFPYPPSNDFDFGTFVHDTSGGYGHAAGIVTPQMVFGTNGNGERGYHISAESGEQQGGGNVNRNGSGSGRRFQESIVIE
ncbi:MAG: hypothetical protein M1834_004633 [Cirrosporium novae-zelandiae]|nr:MAG: hypothetical protein M1834_004633 [Cirrosporium novae-zelandiae]